jgi:hypothetical protein
VPTQTPPFDDRRQSAFAPPTITEVIGRELLRLARPDWLPVLLKWLKRYAGIEAYLDHEADHPANAVVDYLKQLVAPLDDESFAFGLSVLPFTQYQVARHSERDTWDPCIRTFIDFKEQGVAVWRATRDLDHRAIQTWLLIQLQFGDYCSE